MKRNRSTIALMMLPLALACGPGGLLISSTLEPWSGTTEQITAAEGNVLAPNTAYRGNWADTTYYSFDFELTSMVAMEITAMDDSGSPDSLDIKLFSNYVELYSTVGITPHDGVYQMRLPAGSYNLSLQLLPGIDPENAKGWNLRVVAREGIAALAMPVPEKVMLKHQPQFQGNVLNLQGILGDKPSFVDLMMTWLYISVPDYGSYVKPGTLLRPPGSDLAAIFTGTAPGLELLDHEPVIVYELVDLFAARVVTADGLYGLVHIDDLEPSKPANPQLPDTFRVAEGFRMLSPDSDPPARNGGLLHLKKKTQSNKDLKKIKNCLDDIEAKLADEGLSLGSLRLQVIAMSPSDPGYDSIIGDYVEAKNTQASLEEECLTEAWASFGQFITDEERVVAAFDILATIREQFGYTMTEVPTPLPPVLPSLVPPPPPPPPPPPAPVIVAAAPPLPAPSDKPAPPAPAPPPTYATPPGGFIFDEPPPPKPADKPAPAPPPPPADKPAPPPPQPPKNPPPPKDPEPVPPPWQPIIPWGHVDGQ